MSNTWKAVISDIPLVTIHIQKAVYFHIDGFLDLLPLLSLYPGMPADISLMSNAV